MLHGPRSRFGLLVEEKISCSLRDFELRTIKALVQLLYRLFRHSLCYTLRIYSVDNYVFERKDVRTYRISFVMFYGAHLVVSSDSV
jgi:hypothetical protein